MTVAERLRAGGCVFAEDEAAILIDAAESPAELDSMIHRRAVDGEPLEYIVGWAMFCGRRVIVEPGVFVPRVRSELLVEKAIAAVQACGAARPIVVDLCCGTGGVGAAIAHACPVELVACDIDPAAVRCARHNVEPVGGRVVEGDLYKALPTELHGRVDVLVANAPYVPTAELDLMPREARLHEPPIALDGGEEGVASHRRIAAGAARWLSPHGTLLIETSERQTALTADAVGTVGLPPRIFRDADSEVTVVVGVEHATPTYKA